MSLRSSFCSASQTTFAPKYATKIDSSWLDTYNVSVSSFSLLDVTRFIDLLLHHFNPVFVFYLPMRIKITIILHILYYHIHTYGQEVRNERYLQKWRAIVTVLSNHHRILRAFCSILTPSKICLPITQKVTCYTPPEPLLPA